MKKNSFIKGLLFVLTMLLLFVQMIQERMKLFTFKPLNGVFVPTTEPHLTFETYRTGQFQAQFEPFLKENLGFREPLIRFYNQFLFDFFKKSYNNDIIIGKDNWLYFIQHVNDYYGTEMYRWFDSKEEARQAYDREAQLMWKLHGVLKEYDVDFLVFMAPQKGFLYPEHLPNRKFDTTSINAREYYSAKFDEYGFPYIEMTKWFKELKEADTLPYSLFPQTGAHWCFSAALATDSLMRYMADLKGINLPKLQFGTLHESTAEILENDYDIENLANLMRPIRHDYDRLLDAEVTFTVDSTTTQPSAIFIGTSFLLRMYHFVPFDRIFPNSQFWYYNSTAYFGKDYQQVTRVADLDMLSQLLETDYVVWFSEGDQMCKASFGFAESALITLCSSKERKDEVYWQVMDSLRNDPAFLESCGDMNEVQRDANIWNTTHELILQQPEQFFPEIAGDGIPTARNPRIPEVMAIKQIKKDPDWVVKLRCQATYQSLPFDQIMKTEAQNLLNNSILLRDNTPTISREAYVESFVDAMTQQMVGSPEMVTMIEQKAANNNTTYEEQLKADARWIVNSQIDSGEIYWKPTTCDDSR